MLDRIKKIELKIRERSKFIKEDGIKKDEIFKRNLNKKKADVQSKIKYANERISRLGTNFKSKVYHRWIICMQKARKKEMCLKDKGIKTITIIKSKITELWSKICSFIKEKYEATLSTPWWAYSCLIFVMGILAFCYKKKFHYHFSENLMYGIAGSLVVSFLIDLGNTAREKRMVELYKERVLSSCGGSCIQIIQRIAWLAHNHYSCDKSCTFNDWVSAIIPDPQQIQGEIEESRIKDIESIKQEIDNLKDKAIIASDEIINSTVLSVEVDDFALISKLKLAAEEVVVEYEYFITVAGKKVTHGCDLQKKIIQELKPAIMDVFPELKTMLEESQKEEFWGAIGMNVFEMEEKLTELRKQCKSE